MRNRGLMLALTAAWVLNPAVVPAQQVDKTQVESKFAEANGVRLHYLATGQGEPVLLVHGFGQSSQMWRPLMHELAKDHTVIAVDLRGAGQSDTPPDGYTKAEMARDAHALM